MEASGKRQERAYQMESVNRLRTASYIAMFYAAIKTYFRFKVSGQSFEY